SALREAEAAEAAEASQGRAAFLLDASRRLGDSLDETETRATIAGLTLPTLGAWCIVDVIEPGGELTPVGHGTPGPGEAGAGTSARYGLGPPTRGSLRRSGGSSQSSARRYEDPEEGGDRGARRGG